MKRRKEGQGRVFGACYLKWELYANMFSIPHINKFQFLLGALVIEPASREQEDLVGTVLLQLKRNLKRNLTFVTYFFALWQTCSFLGEQSLFYLIRNLWGSWNGKGGTVAWIHVKKIVKSNNRRVLPILKQHGWVRADQGLGRAEAGVEEVWSPCFSPPQEPSSQPDDGGTPCLLLTTSGMMVMT